MAWEVMNLKRGGEGKRKKESEMKKEKKKKGENGRIDGKGRKKIS